MASVSLAEIGLLRLVAQRIAGPRCTTVTEAVRRLTAAQAQDYPGALTSLALRTEDAGRKAVEAALNAGTVVRSWPMRGTLHFVAAEDLRWMLDLMARRIITGAASRRAQLELGTETLERARRTAVDALAGGGQLRRNELLATWERAGIATTGQRGYHLIGHLAQTGTLCFGPLRDSEQALVLLDEWVPEPRTPDREEALGELALRYFRGHGPATVKDFTRWTKLTVADAKASLAAAQPELEQVDVDGTRYFMDPDTPARLESCRSGARGVFLLPGFDEYILGYADRGAVVPAEFADQLVPGNNGMFRATVVSAGQVVGTWKRSGRGVNQTALAAPFTSFTRRVNAAIPRLYDALP
ncbi:MAG: winged helix DNA-binding domain-containing protein [Streptosporangiales bacterium]